MVAELKVALEAVLEVYLKVVTFSVPLVMVTLAKVRLPRLVIVEPSVTRVLPNVALELARKLLGKVAATL